LNLAARCYDALVVSLTCTFGSLLCNVPPLDFYGTG